MITDAQFLAWIKNTRQPRVVLADIDAYSGGSVVTRRVSTHRWVSAPTDTPANMPWRAVLLDAPTWASGAAGQSGGTLVVKNGDGEFDAWLNDAWDGRRCLIRLGAPNWPLADFRTVRAGIIERIADADEKSITFVFRDALARLDDPVQRALLSTGPSENNPIPLVYGTCYNIEPIYTDVPGLVMQVHDGAVQAFSEVRDKGLAVSITASASTGKFTLGASPAGQITADVVGAGGGGSTTATVAGVYDSGLTFKLPIGSVSAITAARFDGSSVSHTSSLGAKTVTLSAWPVTVTADVTVLSATTSNATLVSGFTYDIGVAPVHAIASVTVATVSAAFSGSPATGTLAVTAVSSGVTWTGQINLVELPTTRTATWISGFTYQLEIGTVLTVSSVQINGVSVPFTVDSANWRVTITGLGGAPVAVSHTRYIAQLGVSCSFVSGLTWQLAVDAHSVETVYVDAAAVAFTADMALDRVTLAAAPGTLEADVTVTAITTADAVQAIVTRAGLLDLSEVDAASFAAFKALQPAAVGVFVRDRANAAALVDEILAAAGAAKLVGRDEKLRVWRKDLPTGTPVDIFTAADVEAYGLELVETEPVVKTIRVGCRRNWSLQDKSSLAGGVSDADRENYGKEFLLPAALAENAGITTTHPKPLEPDLIPSFFVETADAEAEAARRAAIGAGVRRTYRVRLKRLAWLDVGDVVQLTHPRLGFASGALGRVIGVFEDWANNTVELLLWR